ncbi:LuxR C-terminal-related transcriptional regulator [Anaerotignum sp.]
MRKYRVLLVEDRTIYRAYFEGVIHSSSRYTLIGTEADMEDAKKYCDHTKIDLILMEAADKEGKPNFAAAADCKKRHPYIHIIVLTSVPEHTYPQRAKQCGADSFWYTENTRESILSVMDRTMEGESIWPKHRLPAKVGQMCSDQFSEKELRILREVMKGYTNKEISERLGMSYYTVRDHVKILLEKTALHSRTELAAMTAYSGMIVVERNGKNTVK